MSSATTLLSIYRNTVLISCLCSSLCFEVLPPPQRYCRFTVTRYLFLVCVHAYVLKHFLCHNANVDLQNHGTLLCKLHLLCTVRHVHHATVLMSSDSNTVLISCLTCAYILRHFYHAICVYHGANFLSYLRLCFEAWPPRHIANVDSQ